MLVLIVAKCNVNYKNSTKKIEKRQVLIVAKCNVNIIGYYATSEDAESINSSKM